MTFVYLLSVLIVLLCYVCLDWPKVLFDWRRRCIDDGYRAFTNAIRGARSRQYANHQHPSADEHRTAEQHNWRCENAISISAAVLTAVVAVFACFTFYETRRQADAALNEQRPWLKFNTHLTEFSVTAEGDLHFGFNLYPKNVGKSPALDVSTQITSFVARFGDLTAKARLANACEIAVDKSRSSGGSIFNPAVVIFPDETAAPGSYVGRGGRVSFHRNDFPPDNEKAFPTIIACDAYRLPSGEYGTTGVVFIINRQDKAGNDLSWKIAPGYPPPLTEFSIQLGLNGDHVK